MDFDWVFLLLITGKVSTNLSQCQMGGQIHVPNFVCVIEPNPRESHAGRRTDFLDKNRAIFSGELFSGEELLPENSFLGQ